MKISLKAFAKLNWSLDILGRRADGYHLLETVMQSLNLADWVTLKKEKGPLMDQEPFIQLMVEDKEAKMPFLPPEEENLAYKAARLFFEELKKKVGTVDEVASWKIKQAIEENEKADLDSMTFGVTIHLIKNIPVQAGLGGGSADAAAVLYGMNRLWGMVFSLLELQAMGLSLGADVPFCLLGGACVARGIGEILIPIEAQEFTILLIKPEGGASTREIYKAYDEEIEHGEGIHSQGVIEALKDGDLVSLAKSMGNALYPASSRLHPGIRQGKETLEAQEGCLKAMMTGSGSAVVGLFESQEEMERGKRQLEELGFRSWILRTVKQGVKEISEGEVLS